MTQAHVSKFGVQPRAREVSEKSIPLWHFGLPKKALEAGNLCPTEVKTMHSEGSRKGAPGNEKGSTGGPKGAPGRIWEHGRSKSAGGFRNRNITGSFSGGGGFSALHLIKYNVSRFAKTKKTQVRKPFPVGGGPPWEERIIEEEIIK